MTDPTRNERQRRFQDAKRRGLVLVHGYLPPKRASKVRQWLAEAERDEKPRQAAAKRQAARKE